MLLKKIFKCRKYGQEKDDELNFSNWYLDTITVHVYSIFRIRNFHIQFKQNCFSETTHPFRYMLSS
jgi:hypothetical protein